MSELSTRFDVCPAPVKESKARWRPSDALMGSLHKSAYSFVSMFHQSDDFWRLLDHTGIAVFAGPNGSGKSLAMIHAALPVLDGIVWECEEVSHRHHQPYRDHVAASAGRCGCDLNAGRNRGVRCDEGTALVVANSYGWRRIYSTVPILDEDGSDHPLYAPLIDYAQLMTIEHADVFFDEVAGVSDASESASMPQQVANYLHKLRKADVRLRCTTPDYDRCSKPIRQACQVVVDCTATFSERATTGRIWRPRKMMRYQAFDARAFLHLTPEKREKLKPLAKAVFWRPGCEAEKRYDTLGAVSMLAHVSEFGVCMSCDGVRRRHQCKCPRTTEPAPLEVQSAEPARHLGVAGAPRPLMGLGSS